MSDSPSETLPTETEEANSDFLANGGVFLQGGGLDQDNCLVKVKIRKLRSGDYSIALKAQFFNVFGSMIGDLSGTIVQRNSLMKHEECPVNDEMLKRCEKNEGILNSTEATTEVVCKPIRMLRISKVTFDWQSKDCDQDAIMHMVETMFCSVHDRFDWVVVPAILDKTVTSLKARSVLLLDACLNWAIWRKIGFKPTTDNKYLLIRSSQLLSSVTDCASMNKIPFLAPYDLLRQIEMYEGMTSFRQCLSDLYRASGIAHEPDLLDQCRFVMDEWGYVGRITKREKCSTVVFWGYDWDLEEFHDLDIRSGQARFLVPVDIADIPSTSTASRKRKSCTDSFLNTSNVKHWRKGYGF